MDSFQEFYHFNKEQANIAVVKYREYFKETGIFENEPYQGIEQILKSLIERVSFIHCYF